jgi:hypothetical protein
MAALGAGGLERAAPPIGNQYFHCFSDGHSYRVTDGRMHGARPTMEDASLVKFDVRGSPGTVLLGVFDGHCGAPASTRACTPRGAHSAMDR